MRDVIEVVTKTRAIVSEAAMTGFMPLEGDWAERLFANQAELSSVLRENSTGVCYEKAAKNLASELLDASSPWRAMAEAPTTGRHVILAIVSGSMAYAVQGVYHDGKWLNAMDIEAEPLCWMPTFRIPAEFLPWKE